MRLEWRRDIKEVHKQTNDDLNDKLTTITREQDDKIQTVNNMSQANTSKIREIEARTVVIEHKIESKKEQTFVINNDNSGEVVNTREEYKVEYKQSYLGNKNIQLAGYTHSIKTRKKAIRTTNIR